MWLQDRGFNREYKRQGSGTDFADEHFEEILGSTEFCVFVTPNKKTNGLDGLTRFLESDGSSVEYPSHSEQSPGDRYKVIKITKQGTEISRPSLRRAHNWAHRRNFLHSFFRPLIRKP